MDKPLDRAIAFATLAHKGQKRKYTGTPYIDHPLEVMGIVRTVPHTTEMLMAAVLHDTRLPRLVAGACDHWGTCLWL